MSRLLLITFEPSEVPFASAFGGAVGVPFDVLNLTGTADAGGEKTINAGLSEVPVADTISKAIASFAAEYTHIALLSSMRSKDLAARLAGHLESAMVTDVIGVDSPSRFRRPVVAGSIFATVEAEFPVVTTFRSSAFGSSTPSVTEVESTTLALEPGSSRTEVSAKEGGRPDLSQAKIVVSGGRPLKDAATFEAVLGGLADALGGAVGATRAAVDSGIAPNELQVGQTGKIVAPDLYIAAGISGSTQHMAGIKDSKVIVAINKDADAPIFESADLGLVADLYDVLPELQKRLPGLRKG